jgi:hypothetical protein
MGPVEGRLKPVRRPSEGHLALCRTCANDCGRATFTRLGNFAKRGCAGRGGPHGLHALRLHTHCEGLANAAQAHRMRHQKGPTAPGSCPMNYETEECNVYQRDRCIERSG